MTETTTMKTKRAGGKRCNKGAYRLKVPDTYNHTHTHKHSAEAMSTSLG
jgi:hypothetical protein